MTWNPPKGFPVEPLQTVLPGTKKGFSYEDKLKKLICLVQGLRKRHVDLTEDGICGSSGSITRVYDCLRDICIKAMKRQERRRKMQMGGRQACVVFDESKFSHKRKYNRERSGRTWKRKRSWVFGMLEVAGERWRPVLKLVRHCNRRHLERLGVKFVKPGSDVISDCWRAYHNLHQRGYVHFQVNHRRYFVHPQTGAHTQHLEHAWRIYKDTVYRFRGNLSEHSLRRTLWFIEWNYWLGMEHGDGPIGRLIHDIQKMYQV
ncbi:uncharacterized protein LOC144465043 [Epinephelus lanceolatus]